MEFSAGLCARAIILDVLIVIDLITSLAEPEESLSKEEFKDTSSMLLESILSDGLNSTYTTL